MGFAPNIDYHTEDQSGGKHLKKTKDYKIKFLALQGAFESIIDGHKMPLGSKT